MAVKPVSPPTVEDLAQQVETLREDISRMTELLGDFGRGKAADATDKASAAAADLRERAKSQARYLQANAQDYASQAEDFMRERPAASVGLAAGLGFLVGCLLSSRR
jgi:ElaB/YqjD/DUF883 family membrane-anchored ribosome-binding protein